MFEFQRLTARYSYGDKTVPEHNYTPNRQLFEACWKGDTTVIQDLCLPRDQKNKHPIAITAIATSSHAPLLSGGDGYTPFSIALQARRWDTCRVILAVATAQYNKPEEKDDNRRADSGKLSHCSFRAAAYVIGSDDEASDEDYDSDATEGQRRPEKFTDIATRFSSIRSDVSPSIFFTQRSTWLNSENKAVTYTPLERAIRENDLEAFTQLVDMMTSLDDPVALTDNDLERIIDRDASTLLDVFIRHSGLGIFVGRIENEATPKDVKIIPKFYLGLSVHGKKRKDLAKRDPHAPSEEREAAPLVFRAAFNGANDILTYLNSDKPLAAYQAYMSTYKTAYRSELLSHIPDFASRLPKLLGILPNSRNETPVIGALVGTGGLKTVKHLLEVFPEHRDVFLNGPVKHIGSTPLHVACSRKLEPEIFDFLVSEGSDIRALDDGGWNILHYLCNIDEQGLLEHVLSKLPEEAKEAMFVQQTDDGSKNTVSF